MKNVKLSGTCGLLLFASSLCLGQNQPSHFQDLKTAYAESGTIVALDDHTLVIEPNMPGPICALPKNEDGKTTWSYYAFPLASITVPLTQVDETLITQDIVFTNSDAPKTYKLGDVGDTTMIVIAGEPGKEFHALMYDREKVTHLGPGPHNASSYGKVPDDVEAFGLTFSDNASAQAFVDALKKAIISAKTQAGQTAKR
jgi:hypothetical protein